jgi:hypothetical protein
MAMSCRPWQYRPKTPDMTQESRPNRFELGDCLGSGAKSKQDHRAHGEQPDIPCEVLNRQILAFTQLSDLSCLLVNPHQGRTKAFRD